MAGRGLFLSLGKDDQKRRKGINFSISRGKDKMGAPRPPIPTSETEPRRKKIM